MRVFKMHNAPFFFAINSIFRAYFEASAYQTWRNADIFDTLRYDIAAALPPASRPHNEIPYHSSPPDYIVMMLFFRYTRI